jgi:hypothetical protein
MGSIGVPQEGVQPGSLGASVEGLGRGVNHRVR